MVAMSSTDGRAHRPEYCKYFADEKSQAPSWKLALWPVASKVRSTQNQIFELNRRELDA